MGWQSRWFKSRQKPTVAIAVPSYAGHVTDGVAKMLSDSGHLSGDRGHPYRYEPLILRNFRPVEYARNVLADAALSRGFERVLYVDDDMYPRDGWWNLLAHEAPIVSGLAFGWQDGALGKKPTLMNVIYRRREDGGYDSMQPASQGPFEADAVGAACLSIHRSVFERLRDALPCSDEPPYPWFETLYARNGKVLLGEDVKFFDKVWKALQLRPLIDPRIVFGHGKFTDLLDIASYGTMCREIGANGAARREEITA